MINRKETFLQSLPPTSASAKLDAAIITSPVHRFYLSNFDSHDGCILATKEKLYYLVDFRYYEAAKNAIATCEVVMMNDITSLKELIKKHQIKSVLIERDCTTLSQKDKLESVVSDCGATLFCDGTLDRILQAMRLIKSKEEIQKIKNSQQLTENAFNHVIQNLKPGMTEQQIALDIEFHMRKNGAKAVAFDLIVVSGANTSLPHGEPTGKPIQNGDLLTLDIGALLDGYHSDMTRTVAIGSIGEKQREIYNIVLEAQVAAINSLKPGVVTAAVDAAARDIISQKGYGDCFGHSTGHGVGLCIHEDPRLSPNSKAILEPGMVVTVEPGIYLNGEFGVRIEDMLLINKNGAENLTHVPKDLLII